MNRDFAKLFFMTVPGNYQVLVTKENHSPGKTNAFEIRYRTELEYYSKGESIYFPTEEERDLEFSKITLDQGIAFFNKVLSQYPAPKPRIETEV